MGCTRSNVGLLGELETRDESGEREADEGEEGHADGCGGRVGEDVVPALAHAVGERDRRRQRGHQEVRRHLEENCGGKVKNSSDRVSPQKNKNIQIVCGLLLRGEENFIEK